MFINGLESTLYNALQDEEVVDLAHHGDGGATEALVARYRPLVESKAKSYFVLGAEREDVVQEGMIGLCKAIRDFDEDRLSRFRPFAELCVTRQIISAVKAATRNKHVPLNASFSLNQSRGEDGSDGAYIDLIADDDSVNPEKIICERRVPADFYEQAQSRLSALELDVLTCYINGKSYQEMSSELHCQTKAIDNALQRVKRKVSGLLEA